MNIKVLFNPTNIIGSPAMTDSAPPPPPRNCRVTGSLLCLLALFVLATQAQAQPHGDSASGPVAQAKPTPDGATVEVFTGATAEYPYTFKAADFAFTDTDGDALEMVHLENGPLVGTLRVGSTVLSVISSMDVALADIGTITYYPAAGQSPTQTYADFAYNVTAGGEKSTSAGTLSIRLVAAPATAATGAPTVAATGSGTAYNEDVQLTADTSGINEPNVINTSTLRWQWQQSATETGTYTAITDATTTTFTPLQAHVGMYIRVCASFMDMFSTPTDEGPLCSTPAIIAEVADAPIGDDSTVTVSTTATAASPHDFASGDFPFMDDDGDSLDGITIASLPTGGTLVVAGDSSVTIAANTQLSLTWLNALAYYPATGATPGNAYDSFTYRVRDDSTGAANTAVDASTLTIDLLGATQAAATGSPSVISLTGTAYDEDEELRASTMGITEPNGINTDTERWQWYQAAAPASGTPAAADYAPIDAADDAVFVPDQPQVGMYIRVCVFFMDSHATPASEGGTIAAPTLCSAGEQVTNANDAPTSTDTSVDVPISADADNPYIFKISDFPFMDQDEGAALDHIGIATTTKAGTFRYGGDPVVGGIRVPANNLGGLTWYPPAGTDPTANYASFIFSVSDSSRSSGTHHMSINLVPPGQNITEQQAVQVAAILAAPAMANAADAIMGGMSAGPNDLSLDGTSLAGTARTLRQSAAAEQNPWYHSTTAEWEYHAAHNATGNSAETLRSRLQSMANGDIAMNWQAGGSAMRFWARYQSIDISGNEGEMLEYDGSGAGFYLGADHRINERMRLGLAISSDSADMTLDLDDDMMDDDASRSATSVYPYLHIDLGGNNQARIIAGIGSGDLDIKSTANNNETVSTGLSWNMLAASISHHRQMGGRLSARFDGSLQLGNTSTDATTFANGSALAAADASTNEIAIDAQLRYQSNNFTPFASLTARKLGGDISQSVALDMAFGADLTTSPANLRIAITRQINDTTHQRHSISIDASTNPNPSGLSASLGSNYDTITGKPQWRTTISWQRNRFQTSLQASPGDYRLRARLRW